jgi:hypothetical protein
LQKAGETTLEAAFIALLPEAERAQHHKVVMRPRASHDDNVPAIEAEGLTRRFGNFTAVDHVSIRIGRQREGGASSTKEAVTSARDDVEAAPAAKPTTMRGVSKISPEFNVCRRTHSPPCSHANSLAAFFCTTGGSTSLHADNDPKWRVQIGS